MKSGSKILSRGFCCGEGSRRSLRNYSVGIEKRALLQQNAGQGRKVSVYAKSPSQCAGLNRHEAGNARVLRERSSEPLGPEFCVAYREVRGEA